jgi:hypothetical protein
MDLKFSNEILFVGGFIIILVLFIQYMMYSHLKKQIKIEIAKTNIRSNKIQQHNKDNTDNKKEIDDDSIDVDTPESEKKNNIKKENNIQNKNTNNENENEDDNKTEEDDDNNDDDSYVNPVHSEKNIDD